MDTGYNQGCYGRLVQIFGEIVHYSRGDKIESIGSEIVFIVKGKCFRRNR